MLTALAPSSLKTVCATFRRDRHTAAVEGASGYFAGTRVEAIATPVDAARTTAASTAQGTAVVLELN